MMAKAKLRKGRLVFWCPGCGGGNHVIPVAVTPPERNWGFNGDLTSPTINPSILVYQSHEQPRCHSFVRDGKIQFLPDCTHELAGKTIEMSDVEQMSPAR